MHKLVIPGSTHAMYINPLDQKGKSLLNKNGLSQPRVVQFWRKAAARLQPTLVVDAGTNYGEILLSAAYPEHAMITAFEANAGLIPYLSRSIAVHPNRSRIKLETSFVSDRPSEAMPFYIDKLRSGNSSGFRLEDREMIEIRVKCVTIDSLFEGKTSNKDTLLFKLDVEGFEWQALRGMARLLSTCARAAGCIEFNRLYLENKGIRVKDFVAFLAERFLLFAPNPDGRLVPLPGPNVLDSLNAYFDSDASCNDLILLSELSLVRKLEGAWS